MLQLQTCLQALPNPYSIQRVPFLFHIKVFLSPLHSQIFGHSDESQLNVTVIEVINKSQRRVTEIYASSPFSTPLGSESISRLFLVIRSLVFSEWLFYQPLWVFFDFWPPSLVWVGLRCTPLNPPFFPMLHFSLFPLPCLSSPEGTIIEPVCTDDLRYHQHPSKWIYSPPSLLRCSPTRSCLYIDTRLSEFSLTLMHATGPVINGETWLFYVCGQRLCESVRLWQP